MLTRTGRRPLQVSYRSYWTRHILKVRPSHVKRALDPAYRVP